MTVQSAAASNRFADESVLTSTGQLDQMISPPVSKAIATADSMPGDFIALEGHRWCITPIHA